MAAPALAIAPVAPSWAPPVATAASLEGAVASAAGRSARESRYQLSPIQQNVIQLLADGASIAEAAETAGVHRSTVHLWRHTNPLFAIELEECRQQIALHWRDQFQARAATALAVVDGIFADPQASPGVRLRAALAVLSAASAAVDPARTLACAIDYNINAPVPPLLDTDQTGQSFVKTPEDGAIEECEEDLGQPEYQEIPYRTRHFSTLSPKIPPPPVPSPNPGAAASRESAPQRKIGRNEPCPCGKNLKYKRCCGRF